MQVSPPVVHSATGQRGLILDLTEMCTQVLSLNETKQSFEAWCLAHHFQIAVLNRAGVFCNGNFKIICWILRAPGNVDTLEFTCDSVFHKVRKACQMLNLFPVFFHLFLFLKEFSQTPVSLPITSSLFQIARFFQTHVIPIIDGKIFF